MPTTTATSEMATFPTSPNATIALKDFPRVIFCKPYEVQKGASGRGKHFHTVYCNEL